MNNWILLRDFSEDFEVVLSWPPVPRTDPDRFNSPFSLLDPGTLDPSLCPTTSVSSTSSLAATGSAPPSTFAVLWLKSSYVSVKRFLSLTGRYGPRTPSVSRPPGGGFSQRNFSLGTKLALYFVLPKISWKVRYYGTNVDGHGPRRHWVLRPLSFRWRERQV